MKLIYLANPFGGLKINICKSIDLEEKLVNENPGIQIFNAVDHYKRYAGKLDEETLAGMYCDMVTRCDEIWLAPGWTNSNGCVREYEAARLAEIKVVYLSADGHAGVEV